MELQNILAIALGVIMILLGLYQVWLSRQANRQVARRHFFSPPDQPYYINIVNVQPHHGPSNPALSPSHLNPAGRLVEEAVTVLLVSAIFVAD